MTIWSPELRRRRAQAAAATVVKGATSTARNRRGGRRGSTQELTAVRSVASASSGKRQSRRTVADDLGDPRLKKTAVRVCRASGDAWGGGDVKDEAVELLDSGGGRGGGSGRGNCRRRRWWRSAVRVRERDRGGDEGEGECKRGRGMRAVTREGQSDKEAARQAAAGVARRGAVAVFSSAFWQEEEDAPALGGPARWLGCQVAGPSTVEAQVCSFSLSLLFSFCFLFFCNCFDLIKMLRHFLKP